MELFFSKCLAQWHNARKETFRASGTAVLHAIKDTGYKRSKSLFLKPMAANDDPKHPFNYYTNSAVENNKKMHICIMCLNINVNAQNFTFQFLLLEF